MNIDASTKDGKNVLAMVARDEKGCIACMASKSTSNLTADLAELATLEWAAEIVLEAGWQKVTWRCDAKIIVDHIISK